MTWPRHMARWVLAGAFLCTAISAAPQPIIAQSVASPVSRGTLTGPRNPPTYESAAARDATRAFRAAPARDVTIHLTTVALAIGVAVLILLLF